MDEELKNEIAALRQEIADLKAGHDKLAKLVYEDIVEPIEKDWNDKKYNEAVGMWKDKYGDKLNPYLDRLKATEGEDFDLFRQSYDDWNETDMDSDQFVEALIQAMDEALEPLSRAFGVPKEDLNATVEIENGEVTDVQADTEPEVGEEEIEIDDTDVEPEDEEEPELSEEEQFQKELDAAFEKQKRM